MNTEEALRDYILELEAENHKLKLTMQLHAGDCCSLNNEVELFKGHWDDAEDRCAELEKESKDLRNFLSDWDGHDSDCGRNRKGFEGCDETMFNCDCGYTKAKRKVLESIK